MRIICSVIPFMVLVFLLLNYLFQCFPVYSSNTDNETSASSMISDRELHDDVYVTIMYRPESTIQDGTCYLYYLDKTNPVLTYSSLLSPDGSSFPSENNNIPDRNCSICLSELCNGDTVKMLPKCKHLFHKKCIDKWLPFRSLSCPICGTPVIGVNIHGGSTSSSSSNNLHAWSMSFTTVMLNLDRILYPHTPSFM